MYENKTGYPTSELVSRIFTGCLLPFNFAPKKLNEKSQEELDIFFNIGSFNNNLFLIKNGFLDKYHFLAELKFDDHFKNAIKNPSEKTKRAAHFYPTWFQMCCHLKILFKDDLEKGLEYFKLFSSLSPKYNEKECEKFFNDCEAKFGSIPGIFSLIDKFIPPEPELNRNQVVKKSFFKN